MIDDRMYIICNLISYCKYQYTRYTLAIYLTFWAASAIHVRNNNIRCTCEKDISVPVQGEYINQAGGHLVIQQ